MEIFWNTFLHKKWVIFKALFYYQNSSKSPQFWAQMMGLALKLMFRIKNQRSGQIRLNAEGFCDVTESADFLTQKGR